VNGNGVAFSYGFYSPSAPSAAQTIIEDEQISIPAINVSFGTSVGMRPECRTGIATVCVISFLYHIADSTFFAFYPALLQNQLGFDAKSIGMTFTGLVCVIFLFSATSLSIRLIEKAGVVNACVAGLGVIGVGLLALSTSAWASAKSMFSWGITKCLPFGAADVSIASISKSIQTNAIKSESPNTESEL